MIKETTCPLCNGPMVRRTARADGRKFWGCARFPECRGTRNTDGEATGRTKDDGQGEATGAPSERWRLNDRRRWE